MYLCEFHADAHVLINSKFKITNRIILTHFIFVYVAHEKNFPGNISVLTSYTLSYVIFRGI